MRSEDRLEGTELHPSEHQFRVSLYIIGLEVSATVMSPIAKAYIGRSGSVIRLELQCTKSRKRITRETQGVTVTTHAAPAMEDHRPTVRAVLTHIIIEYMVQPECLSQAWYVAAGLILLPVEPPEIHSFLLAYPDDIFEEGTVEGAVLQLPGDGGSISRKPHIITYLAEIIIAAPYPISRMQIQGCTSIMCMHPTQQGLRCRDEGFVPCPSRPGVLMPVTIQHQHIMGHLLALHILHYLLELALRISLILAIPIAEHIEGRQRLTASNPHIVAQSIFVLMSIT